MVIVFFILGTLLNLSGDLLVGNGVDFSVNVRGIYFGNTSFGIRRQNNDITFQTITGGTIKLQTNGGVGGSIFINGSGNVFMAANLSTVGNVGIGLTDPNAIANAPLQFATSTVNRKIVLWASVNNDHEFFGFGVNGGTLRYQVNGTADAHVFYAGVNSTTSAELIRINGSGNLILNNNSIYLRGNGDVNHGLRYGATNDGLDLFGLGGGRLIAGITERLSWNTSGVIVNGILTANQKMQSGNRATPSTGDYTITFPVAFGTTPIVVVSVDAVSSNASVATRNVSTTGFIINVSGSPGVNNSVNWIAMRT